MQATSKLRALRKLKPRDRHQPNSPDMHLASRRDQQQSADASAGRRANHHQGDSTGSIDAAGDRAPRRWRRNSSAEIPIPSFMIPCSASTLMNSHYALASPTEASQAAPSSFATRPNYATAIQQR